MNALATSASVPALYLASQSPRRLQLLSVLGVTPSLLLPGTEAGAATAAAQAELQALEALEAPLPREAPADYVQRVTRLKCQAARERLRLAQRDAGWPLAPILTADTTVAIGQRILGKPADAAEARAMLQALSGRWHRVHTAVVVWDGRRTHAALSTSRVCFAELTPQVIGRYIASGEPFGKAGAYAIQGALAAFIARIDGSHSGIMGLPLHETARLLARAGVPTALT